MTAVIQVIILCKRLCCTLTSPPPPRHSHHYRLETFIALCFISLSLFISICTVCFSSNTLDLQKPDQIVLHLSQHAAIVNSLYFFSSSDLTKLWKTIQYICNIQSTSHYCLQRWKLFKFEVFSQKTNVCALFRFLLPLMFTVGTNFVPTFLANGSNWRPFTRFSSKGGISLLTRWTSLSYNPCVY